MPGVFAMGIDVVFTWAHRMDQNLAFEMVDCSSKLLHLEVFHYLKL